MTGSTVELRYVLEELVEHGILTLAILFSAQTPISGTNPIGNAPGMDQVSV